MKKDNVTTLSLRKKYLFSSITLVVMILGFFLSLGDNDSNFGLFGSGSVNAALTTPPPPATEQYNDLLDYSSTSGQ